MSPSPTRALPAVLLALALALAAVASAQVAQPALPTLQAEPRQDPATEPEAEAEPGPGAPEARGEPTRALDDDAGRAADGDAGRAVDDAPPDAEEAAAELAPSAVPAAFELDGAAVVALGDDEVVWSLDFPEGSGGTGALLETGEALFVGHGNSVLVVDKLGGRVLRRYPMPGRVAGLELAGDAVSAVVVIDGGIRQRIEIGEEGPQARVRFGTDPELFTWLRREARVDDVEGRLEQDPTNPWLYLAAGLAAEAPQERERLLAEAVERGQTFFDLAGLARSLYAAGHEELAEVAMDRSLRDFAERGYEPALLTDPELHEAYNFPLQPLRRALDASDLEAAGFWAPWLLLLSSPEAPATRAALARYAEELRAAGEKDAAALWRERAEAERAYPPEASLDRFFLALADAGWYAAAALLAAIVALQATLTAKYWIPQSLAMRRRRETGGNAGAWRRLFAIRYFSFTEKLVLVLLFAACLALLGLARWHAAAGELPRELGAGTLASAPAQELVADPELGGARGAFVRGYAAQVAGDAESARSEYLAAGEFAPALNNLGALNADESLYQRALAVAPGFPEAAYNLGRIASPSPFHARYRASQPLLAVPGPADFRTALAGSWQQALARTFANPWLALQDTPFFGLPRLLWQTLLALFLLWGVATLLWTAVPRPSLARNAPRTATYHLLALLVPGSGLADEAWGLLLIVPWALLGVDLLARLQGWERLFGLGLESELWALGLIYLVNLLAFLLEYASYRRRMRLLWQRHPEAAQAYGVRVRA